jgi:RHS repeat-associated protein
VQRVTDPAGRWKEYTKDGLGRLVKVTEPDPAQAGAVHETVYAWNGFDKLTQVTMTRGPVTQVRTFEYDARMRLVSETHPETGTKSYGYDDLNRLTAKTDAKNQQVKSIYDNYHRVVRIERYPVANGAEDLAQRTTFTYDTGTGTNLMGRVSEIVYGTETYPVKERFSYTAAGLVTEKTLVPGAHPSLVGQWTWDNEGKMLSVKYPNWAYWDSGLHPVAGEKFVYTYDAMGMALGMALDTGTGYVTSAEYNAAGQMTRLVRGAGLGNGTETWQYGPRGLMANDNGTQYTYGDDGKVVTKTGPVAGETIGYSYDSLGRLATATANTWGLAWDYDGFGNRYAQRVTKGSAPVVSFPVDKTKNRLIGSGWSYDANGNATSTPAVSYLNYDIENRVTLEQANWYSPAYSFTYDAANRRLTENGVFHFYGLNGELLGQYEKKNDGYASNSNMHMRRVDNSQRVWFAGRLVKKGGATITTDRLGSVATEYGSAVLEYYPYGEEVAATTNDGREKYATYRRDATGLDYAWNRMYAATYGRFLSADPYRASASMTNPQSWNRYAYVENDPVNYTDPNGLNAIGFCNGSTSAGMSDTTQAMCAMMFGPRPSIGDLYNSSGLALGMQAPSGSGGSSIGSESADLSAAESNHVVGAVVDSYLRSALEGNPVLTQAALPPGAVSATITYGEAEQNSSILSALTVLPQMFWEGWAQMLLNGDPRGAVLVGGSLVSAAGSGLLSGLGGRGVSILAIPGLTGGSTPLRLAFTSHGPAHLVGTGLSRSAVERAIAADIGGFARTVTSGAQFWGRVVVQGTTIEYRAFPMVNGTINIGTYYLP